MKTLLALLARTRGWPTYTRSWKEVSMSVEVEKANKGYEECTSCHSTEDVFKIKFGTLNMMVVKLCRSCRSHTIAKLSNVTPIALDYSTGMSLE